MVVATSKAESPLFRDDRRLLLSIDGELFTDLLASPFMERTGRLKPATAARLPAAAAAEGRARVQTVDAEREPLLHRLLKAVEERTGVAAVINTSLNEPGRPIATTPREAIGSLYTSGLDALALGPYILAK